MTLDATVRFAAARMAASGRKPTQVAITSIPDCASLTVALIGMLRFKRIVAIGRDAAEALAGSDVPVRAVRHPSQGGRRAFVAGIGGIYGIADAWASDIGACDRARDARQRS